MRGDKWEECNKYFIYLELLSLPVFISEGFMKVQVQSVQFQDRLASKEKKRKEKKERKKERNILYFQGRKQVYMEIMKITGNLSHPLQLRPYSPTALLTYSVLTKLLTYSLQEKKRKIPQAAA